MRRRASHIPVDKMAEHRFEERITSPKARWYFTKQELQDSPSRVHGVDPDKELSYRQQAANMIQDMGQRLNVNQLCINTGIVYMHRFYTVHSFRTFHRANVATAAIFLAAKVEEQPRKLEHVAKVSYACQNRDAPTLDTQNEVYTRLIEDVTYHELMILETLGFEVAVDHPHQHVVKCTHLLRASKDLSQTAYFMAHNSLLLTTFCLEHRPTVVACVCIHLACRWKGLQIPRSSDNKDWWQYVDSEITLEQLNSLTKEFLLIYEKCPSRLQKKITEPMKSKLSSADQPSASSSSASRHTSTDKGKLNAHSFPHKHKPTNTAAHSHTGHSQAHPPVPSQPQTAHKLPSLPYHHQQQQHSKHTNTSHHNTFTAGPKSHDVKHHVEQPSASKHHGFLPAHTHSSDRSNSSLPPGVAGKVPHKHHKSQLQGSSSKPSEFGGKHPISGSGGAGKVMGADQKQRAAKHRLANPNHDNLKAKRVEEHQKVALKRPHSGENPERKKPRLDHPPLPPFPSISGMPPLPPLPSEPELPPLPPSLLSSQVPQMPFKGLPFQAPQTGHFPPLPSVPDLPPLPPPLPLSPDDSFPPPPPPPPANSR